LIAHRPGRERVHDRLRRAAAQRVERRRARVVAVVTTVARAIEECRAGLPQIGILPARSEPCEDSTEQDRNDGEESLRTPNQNNEDIIGT
jgi:hypothetical protein